MKARNSVSVPTVMWPLITRSPPTHSTSPMATKNAKFMEVAEETRVRMRRAASARA